MLKTLMIVISRLFVVIVEFGFGLWCCFLILITHCCQDPFLVAVVHVLFTIRNGIMVFGLTAIAIAIVWKVLRASNCGVANAEFCRILFMLFAFPPNHKCLFNVMEVTVVSVMLEVTALILS